MAIDYGRKRCGLAVTDPLRIAGTALDTVPASAVLERVLAYIAANEVDIVIVGQPTQLNGLPSERMRYITPFVARLRKALPESVEVVMFDERFTSTIAHRAMLDGGLKKSDRRDKALVDRMAATIILNDYLMSRE